MPPHINGSPRDAMQGLNSGEELSRTHAEGSMACLHCTPGLDARNPITTGSGHKIRTFSRIDSISARNKTEASVERICD